MDLSEQVNPIEKVKWGKDAFDVTAGERFKILNGSNDIFNEKVPNGKTWRVTIDLRIEESSA